MRHVFTNRELPHLWAHRTQSDGRTSNGNMFFADSTIYSYGNHFPIARHYTTPADHPTAPAHPFILFTTRDYSVTTSGHKSRVRQAIPSDSEVLYVERVTGTYSNRHAPDHDVNLRDLVSTITDAIGKAARARKTRSINYELGRANGAHATFLRYCELFSIAPDARPALPDVPAPDSARLAELTKREREESARKAAREKARRIEESKRLADFIALTADEITDLDERYPGTPNVRK